MPVPDLADLDERGTVLWEGFDFAWARTPHRLNGFASVVEARYDPSTEALVGEHLARFTVGRVPDRATARTFVSGMRAPDLRFAHGTTRLVAEGTIGTPILARAEPVVVRLPASLPKATAVLRGVEIACLSSPVGLHTQGFGVRLGAVHPTDDGLSFTPEWFVHASNSPDVVTQGRGPYAYAATVHWTVVAGGTSAFAFVEDPEETPGCGTATGPRVGRATPRPS